MKKTLFITSKDGQQLEHLLDTAKDLSLHGAEIAFLFFGDGVYSVVDGSIACKTLQKYDPSIEFQVCLEDVESRGLSGRVANFAKTLDYDGIVDLIMNNSSKVVSYV